jgi:Protein of unknown function (DUF1579)
MTTLGQLEKLFGTWSGNSWLWLTPDEDPLECLSTADIGPICQGQFVRTSYTWEIGGKPQDGVMIFGVDADASLANAVWLDSWHMARQIMVCDCIRNETCVVIMTGTYPAPPGPDWGWRIEIQSSLRDSFTIRMFNISPEGQDALAVLGEYQRQESVAKAV